MALSTPTEGTPGCPVLQSSVGQGAAPRETSSGHGAAFWGAGGDGGPAGSAEVQLRVGLGGSAGWRWGCAELRREGRRRGATTPRPLASLQTPPTPKAHGWPRLPLGEDWGRSTAVTGLTGRSRVAARSGELCPLPTSSCLQPAGSGSSAPSPHAPPAPLPVTAALTSQRRFGRGAGGQTGSGHKARRGEGWRGWRGQLL